MNNIIFYAYNVYMPKKSRKRSRKGTKTRKQKVYNMIGCFKKHKHSKSCVKDLGTDCPKCGPNCHCGPNCKCPHNCNGSCYLNRRIKKGGQCAMCSIKQMGGQEHNNVTGHQVTGHASVIDKDPQLQSMQSGGFFPQDLVNLGRSFAYNFDSAYNTLNGYSPSFRPLPTQDQLTHSSSKLVL
jgi:hypothetical protein